MNDGTADLVQQRLRAMYPNGVFDLARFDSGAWMLDMRLGPRFFVISFSPRDGYGWDEVDDEPAFTSTFSNAAADANDLIEQLSEAIQT